MYISSFFFQKLNSARVEIVVGTHNLKNCTKLKYLHFSVVVCVQDHFPSSMAMLSLLCEILTRSSQTICSLVVVIHVCWRNHSTCDEPTTRSLSFWSGLREAADDCSELQSMVFEVEHDWEVACTDAFGALKDTFKRDGIIKRVREFSMLL